MIRLGTEGTDETDFTPLPLRTRPPLQGRKGQGPPCVAVLSKSARTNWPRFLAGSAVIRNSSTPTPPAQTHTTTAASCHFYC